MRKKQSNVIKHILAPLIVLFLSLPAQGYECANDGLLIGQIRRNLQKIDINDDPTENPRIESIFFNGSEILYESERNNSDDLHGYLISRNADNLKGYFLILLGNTQPAELIIRNFVAVSDLGYDVIVFNYRGLLSGPKSTVKILVEDTRKIVRFLNSEKAYRDKHHVLYGISSGGIFALQALDLLAQYDTVLLDSVPDKISRLFWCDYELYPSNAISSIDVSSLNLLALHGDNDDKVLPYNSVELISTIEENGGCHMIIEDGGHPFEPDDNVDSRISKIVDFLNSPDCEIL